jgi:hypothetical protein
MGIEPTTCSLATNRSSSELPPRNLQQAPWTSFSLPKLCGQTRHHFKGHKTEIVVMVDLEGIEPSTPDCKTSVFPLALQALLLEEGEGFEPPERY